MITIREAEEILKKEYHIDNFTYMVDELILPDFKTDKHEVVFNNSIFASVNQLGYSVKCDVTVYEVLLNDVAQNRRVTITQEMFRILRGQGINNAIVAFANADKRNYRLSLLTSKYEFDGNKVVKVLSNPRRYSYSLGYGTKTKTAYDFLISKGKVHSLDELIGRFSIEIVNKHFYNEIALSFTKLIGGKRESTSFEKELNLYGVTNQNKYAEFAVRLIGRIVFCWFLKEKKSEAGIPLVPENMLSIDAIKNSTNYYHDVLEPLFFELLNTNQNRRKNKFINEDYYKQIPYLNGGLFSPHVDDRYKFDMATGGGQYGVVTIENGWFEHFIGVLSQYNFTVDENTSYDIELSIDPEMLGRIFENLLAEINPETGENAKKNTGSFYTPRDIVDYMVDNSILEYLKTKTGLDETRLKALISYSKEDDDIASFTNAEKKAIISALYTVTVLDPACGSGAFPIGMLQKIVYMLQEIDPEANLWFDEIVKGAPIYVRKAFEEKFSNGELDYIRKLTVIEKSIYGVDIQPIAVEIARLRCFLSLVIEQKVNDALPNRGVHPLPSLDFKFLIANSLVKLPDDSSNHMGMKVDQLNFFENVSHIDELKAVREEYFNADNERKAELREEFADIQKRMFQQTLSMAKNASPRYSALSNWSPFKNEPTNWFDAEWMFGVKDGFDIVIANPPYGADIDKFVDYYKKIYPATTKGFKDIYKLFYDLSINFLLKKETGILSFITPNTYLSQPRYKDLRKLILTTKIFRIVNLGFNMFTATVPTAIIVLKNSKAKGQSLVINDISDLGSIEEKVANINNGVLIEQAVVEEEKTNNFLYVLSSNSTIGNLVLDDILVFKDAGINYQRVNVGLQQKGKSDLSSRLLYEGKKENEEDVEYWKGEDISEFYMKPSTNRYVRPNIYLEKNERVVINKNYFTIKPKLLWRQTAPYPICVLDDKGIYFGRSIQAAIIKSGQENYFSYEYLCCLLNSKYIRYLYNKKVHESGRVFPQVKLENLKSLPIILPDAQLKLDVEKIYFKIIDKINDVNGAYKVFVEEMNQKIYQIYNLSLEEIALVEESVK